MELLVTLAQQLTDITLEEILGFTGFGEFINIVSSGDPDLIFSLDGLYGLFAPLMFIVFMVEIVAAMISGKFKWENIRVPLLCHVVNRVIGRTVSLSVAFAVAALFAPLAPFTIDFSWYGLIIAYFVLAFAHFIYHWLGHRVRIFWCLHATHHCPSHMNLSVSYAHFVLEAPFADFIRIGICTLAGLDPLLIVVVSGIDSLWGSFIHVGGEMMPEGRMSKLEKYILTPAHHRVHHAKNPQYMDKNFCNLIPVWDRLFGTYQRLQEDNAPNYGITREIDSNNFYDVYFSECVCLIRDIKNTPGLANKLLLLVMPPGWVPAELRQPAVTEQENVS